MTSLQDSAAEQYALIHRAVESGQATDTTWQKLVDVCIELDKKDEALGAATRIQNAGLRQSVQRHLARKGWRPAGQPEAHAADAAQVTVTDADMNPTTREKFEDAVRFLLDGRTAMYMIVGTVAFPLLMAVAGVFIAVMDHWVTRGIAAVPVLGLFGMVVALARHILVLSIHSVDDGEDLPGAPQLAREATAALRDIGAVALFLLPGVASAFFAPWWLTALLFAAALVPLPMAAALLLATQDWRALKFGPLTAAMRAVPGYLQVAGVTAALFVPATIAGWLALGWPVYLVVSIVGALSVLPGFVAMRMLGLLLYYERESISSLFTLPPDPRSPVAAGHGAPHPVRDGQPPERAQPQPAARGQAPQGHAAQSGQGQPGQGQARQGQARPGQARPGQPRPAQALAGQSTQGQRPQQQRQPQQRQPQQGQPQQRQPQQGQPQQGQPQRRGVPPAARRPGGQRPQ